MTSNPTLDHISSPENALPLPIPVASPSRNVDCPYCDYRCAFDGPSFRRHLTKHKQYKCKIAGCGKSMQDDKRTIERHKRTVHRELFPDVQPFLCECGKSNSRRDHLKRHKGKCRF